MEHLEIKNRTYIMIRKGLGILMILTAISWLVLYTQIPKIVYLAASIIFTFYGIYLKAKKPLKLNIDFLEREQKKEVYEFLIAYAKKRDLNLLRDF